MTLAVVLQATLVLHAATWSSQSQPWWGLVDLGIVVLAMTVVAVKLRLRKTQTSPGIVVFLCALWCWPFVSEFLWRRLFYYGNPLEMQTVCSLRNVMIGLAVLQRHTAAQKLACAASVFLVLYSFMQQLTVLTGTFTAIYALTIMGWLIGVHWERLQGKMPAHTRRELPKRAALGAMATVALVVVVSAIFASSTSSARQLWGFFPSSGGTRRADPFAWSGVGEGDQVVAAQEVADSFGAVDTDVFLESQMPSLFDVFDETYGEPNQQKRRAGRSVALASRPRSPAELRKAISEASGRNFSASRSGPRQQRALEDRHAQALCYVAGRTPLHLRLETYDTFADRTWTQSDTRRFFTHLRLESADARPWIRTSDAGSHPLLRGETDHVLKILRLKTNRIPAPPQLKAVRIDRVDRADLFGWTGDGAMELREHEAIPPLTVIHVRAHGINLAPLREAGDFTARLPRASRSSIAASDYDPAKVTRDERIAHELAPCYETPAQAQEQQAIAERWVAGTPRGWRQVEAVVARLRADFTHDPHAVPPSDCDDVIAHFLVAQRGPDYLFATTAAILLRTLGYPTRLASGFYVRPERYDRPAAQTPVLAEDVHVWAEVCVDGYHWIAIEPTPGFAPPRESLNWQQTALAILAAGAAWLKQHFVIVMALLALASAMFLGRRRIALEVGLALWWLCARGSVSRQVLWTVWLLDLAARLASHPRPAHATLMSWHTRAASNVSPELRRRVQRLLTLANDVLYGAEPGRSVKSDPQLVAQVCRDAAFSYRLLPAAKSEKHWIFRWKTC